MVEEVEIWQMASELVKLHGDLAPIEAAMTADEFRAKNDYAGQAACVKIKAAAEELLKDKPDGEVH